MIEMIYTYPYFFGTFFVAGALYIVTYKLLRRQRKWILLSSLFALPQALAALILVPEYWAPKRIMVLGIDPEDILFSFIVGGMA